MRSADTLRRHGSCEAPPRGLSRFFYYSDVRRADHLFLGVTEVLYPREKGEYLRAGRPAQLKEKLLHRLQGDGFWLLDVLDVPVQYCTDPVETAVPNLVKRLRGVVSSRTPIILIKATTYDAAADTLRCAGFNVIPVRVPFPGQGWQRAFRTKFNKALTIAGWHANRTC